MSATTDGAIDITVRVQKIDLYWQIVRSMCRFPVGLLIIAPFSYIIYDDVRSGRNLYASFMPLAFLLGIIPWFAVRNSPWSKQSVRLVFSDSGITTVLTSTSHFAEWSWIKTAVEDDRLIRVTYKNSFILIPKDQVAGPQLAAIREMLRRHLGKNARLHMISN
jgi:hypothetical protein